MSRDSDGNMITDSGDIIITPSRAKVNTEKVPSAYVPIEQMGETIKIAMDEEVPKYLDANPHIIDDIVKVSADKYMQGRFEDTFIIVKRSVIITSFIFNLVVIINKFLSG